MGITWKRALIAGVSVVALSAGLQVQAAPLEEAVQALVRDNPTILEAAANRRALDFELEQARGLYRPQIDLTTRVGPEWSTLGPDAADEPRLVHVSSLTLRQLLFDGFATESEIERQAARVDAAAERVRERSEFIALDLVEAYLDIMRHQELVALAEDNVRVHAVTLGDVRERVEGGQTGVGDVQQAEGRYADAKATRIEARQDLDEAINRYLRLAGREEQNMSRPEFKWAVLPVTQDEAVDRALKLNPTLFLADADIDVAKANIAAAKSNNYPTVTGVLGANHNYQVDRKDQTYNAYTAQLRMDWNLYRGLIDRHNVYEQVERLSETRAARLRLEREVIEEVRQSWNAMTKARERAEVLNDQVVANGQVVSTYRQEFQVGERDLLDVLDSENELFTSRVRAVTADYTALFGAYRLLASTGELLSYLGVSIRGEATGNRRDNYGVTPEYRWETDYQAGDYFRDGRLPMEKPEE